MGRTTGLLQKGYTAAIDIAAHKLLKFGAADGTVTLAVDATAAIIGVQSQLDVEAGDRASAAMVGNIEDVIYGGNVARGDPLTADGTGRAIKATGAAGTLLHCIGFAEVSGVAGDIGTVIISPFIMQGA
jgi:hypothetical protein